MAETWQLKIARFGPENDNDSSTKHTEQRSHRTFPFFHKTERPIQKKKKKKLSMSVVFSLHILYNTYVLCSDNNFATILQGNT